MSLKGRERDAAPNESVGVGTTQVKYDELVRIARLMRSNENTIKAVMSNTLATRLLIDAAMIARENQEMFAPEKVRNTANLAFEVAMDTGLISMKLGNDNLARMSLLNGLEVATTFGLGKEFEDKVNESLRGLRRTEDQVRQAEQPV